MKYWDSLRINAFHFVCDLWFHLFLQDFLPILSDSIKLIACYIFVRFVHIDPSFSVGDKRRQVNNLLNKAKTFFNQANDSMTTYHQTNNTYFKDTVYSVGY